MCYLRNTAQLVSAVRNTVLGDEGLRVPHRVQRTCLCRVTGCSREAWPQLPARVHAHTGTHVYTHSLHLSDSWDFKVEVNR